ncbi:hypothetical protein AAH067_07990 [Parabacteroides distasonis]
MSSYLPGRTSVPVRVRSRTCPATSLYLPGCIFVSARLQECICPATGMYLPGCKAPLISL